MSQISKGPLRLLQNAISLPPDPKSGHASKAGSSVNRVMSVPSAFIVTMSAPLSARSATAIRPPSPMAAGASAAVAVGVTGGGSDTGAQPPRVRATTPSAKRLSRTRNLGKTGTVHWQQWTASDALTRVHSFRNGISTLVQVGLDGSFGHAENGGDVGDRKVLVVVQREDGGLLARQRADGCPKLAR